MEWYEAQSYQEVLQTVVPGEKIVRCLERQPRWSTLAWRARGTTVETSARRAERMHSDHPIWRPKEYQEYRNGPLREEEIGVT